MRANPRLRPGLITIGALAFFLIASIEAYGQTVEEKIDFLIKAKLPPYGSGITAIIVQKGKTIYHRAFGKADVELDVDMRPDQVMPIGSITKQFTACAVLKLAEEGKLNLDDEITKYLPGYPTQGQKITIEHLLTHTSGIKSYTDLPEWTAEFWKKDLTPAEMIDFFKRDQLDFMPGEKFYYSSTNYFLLGVIIEKVSGKSYGEYISDNFFKPLGMNQSRYDSQSAIIPGRASGYELSGRTLRNARPISASQPFAAGSLLSTVADLAKWYRAVFSHRVISAESLKKAHTAHRLKDGSSTGYGFGWIIAERFGKPTVEHGGAMSGFQAKDLYFPEEDLFLAMFSNCLCFKPDALVQQMAAIVLGVSMELKEVKLERRQMEKLLGRYELNASLTLTVNLEGEQLFVEASGLGKFRLTPLSEYSFIIKEVEAEISFTESGGRVTGLVLTRSGMKMPARRIE